MTVAVAGNRSAVGVAVAEVNLKFIWEEISAIRWGAPAKRSCSTGREGSSPIPTSAWCCGPTKPAAATLQALRDAILAQARPGGHRSGHCGEDGAGGDGADPRRRLERHRQATARRGIRADLRGAVAHRGVARRRRRSGGGARLLADPAHGGPDTPAGGRRRPIGAGQFDHRISSRPATNSSGSRPDSTRWRRAVGFAGALGTHQPAQALPRAASGRAGRPHRRRPRSRRAAGRGGRGVLRPAGFTAFSARAEPETIIGVLREYYDALERVVSATGQP